MAATCPSAPQQKLDWLDEAHPAPQLADAVPFERRIEGFAHRSHANHDRADGPVNLLSYAA